MAELDFNVPAAQRYAREGRLEEWIHAYLNTGHWANLGLSQGLRLQKRYWAGPVEMELAQLIRCCGPEPEMEYRMTPEAWEERVTRIARGLTPDGLTHPLDLPPLIAQYRGGLLSLRDGNHRHEAMRRTGWRTAWALIWYDTEDDWRKDRQRHADTD
jgi:hypothetical protein